MEIILIGNNEREMSGLKTMIRSIRPNSGIAIRNSGEGESLGLDAQLVKADIVIIDIAALGHKGLNLARALRDTGEKINIILMVDDNRYDMASFEVRASGLLRKPFTWDKVRFELTDLRYPVD